MVRTLTNTLKASPVESYESLVREAYGSDEDFLRYFHEEAGSGLDRCVERTLHDFSKAAGFKFYEVRNDKGEFVAYFGEAGDGTSDNRYLCGFFVMPKFRKFIIENKIWRVIHDHFCGEFYCGIAQHNYKAVNFLFMGGGVIEQNMEYNSEAWYLFKFKN